MSRQYRLLWIDNDDQFLANASKILNDKQYQIDLAASCQEALNLMTSHPPDLILMEWDFPNDEANHILDKIKQKPLFPSIIVVSQNSHIDTVVAAFKSGISDYLTKPIKSDIQLKNAVTQALKKNKTQERLHNALQESQERLRLTMESTNDGIWDWRPQTSYIYFSPRWFTLLGYEPNIFPHSFKTFQQLLHPDDQERLEHFFCDQLENQKPFSIEFRMKTNDNHWLWLESRGKAMEWDDSGNVTRIMGTLSDITERKQAEMELFRHSQALQQSLDGIVITDLSGTIEFVNQAWAQMHEYDVDDLIGKNLYIFMKPPQQANLLSFLAKVKEKSGLITDDKHLTKDGRSFSIRLSAIIFKEASVDAAGVVIIGRDITDERNLEAQLLQAQKMESIGRLAGGIAHDFNNLLSPILANTQMLLTDNTLKLTNKLKLDRILTAAERASDLTRQILTFSRKQPLEMQTFRLAEVVDGFHKILSSVIREDIQISLNTSDSKGYIHADISHIEQILINIMVNAQDAMSHGGQLLLTVSDTSLDETYAEKHPDVTPGSYVMLVISDNGAGMSRETLKQAFEPFYTTKEKSKGTGLGLSTVYGIVKQHGGHIRLNSKLHKGTTFTFYFPQVSKIDLKAPSVYPPQQQTGFHETVVVVEDEDIVRDLVCSILKRLGYHVLDAQDAASCLSFLDHYDGPIHLLITDVVMPGINGKELYFKLLQQYPDIKVLFMSGYAEDIILDRGIQEFLQKPISVKKLAETVKRILKNDAE